jgi:hypothetical protein
LASTAFTLTSFAWFILDNLFRTWNYLPGLLASFARLLRICDPNVIFFNQANTPKKKIHIQKDNQASKINEITPKLKIQTENQLNIVDNKLFQVSSAFLAANKRQPLGIHEEKIKEDELKKKRRELELNVTALNRFVFAVITFTMLITNLFIWLYLAYSR